MPRNSSFEHTLQITSKNRPWRAPTRQNLSQVRNRGIKLARSLAALLVLRLFQNSRKASALGFWDVMTAINVPPGYKDGEKSMYRQGSVHFWYR